MLFNFFYLPILALNGPALAFPAFLVVNESFIESPALADAGAETDVTVKSGMGTGVGELPINGLPEHANMR